MTLIVLACVLTVVFAVIAFRLAVFALPVMIAAATFRCLSACGLGLLASVLVAACAALLSVAVVVAILAVARNPMVRLIALTTFAAPATIAGYILVYAVAKSAFDSSTVPTILSAIAGLAVGATATAHLNALGTVTDAR